MVKFRAIRGMYDILMHDTPSWQYIEQKIKKILISYGYQEIRLPIIEQAALFSRSIGSASDIVSKEMYTFYDRNGDCLALRPEGTAGCVRAGIEHGLFHNQTQRLWYTGPMFRHERPQKGRQRQFHQIGVEAFGFQGPDIDAEMIILCRRIWRALGIDDVHLEINSLGTHESRERYRQRLVDYFTQHKDQLDEDSLVRLKQNPLRILDSKNPQMRTLIANAPVITNHLDAASKEHFDNLKDQLDASGVIYAVNPLLVRGLDYYEKTVFEWRTDRLGAQGTVCAGGRYDRLAEQYGASPTVAAGFAIGLERLKELCQFVDTMPDQHTPHVYIILAGDLANQQGMRLAENIRDQIKDIRVTMHCGGGGMKSQFKKADKSGAEIALILGDNEIKNNEITIKYLRDSAPQQTIAASALIHFLRKKWIL